MSYRTASGAGAPAARRETPLLRRRGCSRTARDASRRCRPRVSGRSRIDLPQREADGNALVARAGWPTGRCGGPGASRPRRRDRSRGPPGGPARPAPAAPGARRSACPGPGRTAEEPPPECGGPGAPPRRPEGPPTRMPNALRRSGRSSMAAPVGSSSKCGVNSPGSIRPKVRSRNRLHAHARPRPSRAVSGVAEGFVRPGSESFGSAGRGRTSNKLARQTSAEGQISASTHSPQRGRRAMQTWRPWKIRRWESSAHGPAGNSGIRSCSIFTGSSWRVRPEQPAEPGRRGCRP